MKVLAFNGSPRGRRGATDRILQKFLEGAAERGGECETIYLAQKKINYCTGCFNCWTKHPGRCIHNDDMADILRQIRRAELMVYATPVYVDGMTAQMKTMLDRCITGAEPFIEVKDGHSRHPGRGKGTGPRKKIVLISCCGFGELDNFEPLIHHFQAIAKNMHADFLGALVRPMGPILEFMEQGATETINRIYEGFRRGGREAVEKGIISREAQEAASAPFMTLEQFQKLANAYFRMEIQRNAARATKEAESVPPAVE